MPTVKFDDLECRPSNSTIGSADRRMRPFDVQPAKFNDLEWGPSISLTSVSCDGQCLSLRYGQFAHGAASEAASLG